MVHGNSEWDREELYERSGNFRFASSRQNTTAQKSVLGGISSAGFSKDGLGKELNLIASEGHQNALEVCDVLLRCEPIE